MYLERARSPAASSREEAGGPRPTALAALLGLYHGYFNGAGLGQFATAAVDLLGLAFAVFAVVALAAAFAVPLRAQRTRIAVRVAGSWIAASGLLLLAWAVRTA